MNLSFLDEFSSPSLLGIPLILISVTFPALLLLSLGNWWIINQLSTLQLWFVNLVTKQLMMPLDKKGHKWALILTSLTIFLPLINLLGQLQIKD